MRIRTLLLLALLAVQAMQSWPAAAQSTTDAPLVIEQLECRGNATTSCAYILSYLYLSAGSEVDEEEIRNARYRLSALPNFTEVRIYLEKGSARGKANLIVEVVEANPLFSEALAGVANHGGHALALRIGHQNLFGAGERLELTASARVPIIGSEVERDSLYANLQYIDPMLFGAERWFFSANASYLDRQLESRSGDLERIQETGLGFMVGARIADFSYLALGYRYLTDGSFDSRSVKFDGTFVEVKQFEYHHQLQLDYGWNSEDDPYFPTQGGRLRAGVILAATDSRVVNGDELTSAMYGRFKVGYRHTWAFGGRNYIRLKIGTSPGTESRNSLDDDSEDLALSYERTLPTTGLFAGIERGRWYVEAMRRQFLVNSGQDVEEVGLKAGLRLDTRRFGIVELYVLGTKENKGK